MATATASSHNMTAGSDSELPKKELDRSFVSTSASVSAGARATVLSHLVEPLLSDEQWFEYYKNVELGRAVDPAAKSYMDWLMTPIAMDPSVPDKFAAKKPPFSSADSDATDGKNGNGPAALPGSCEFRLERLRKIVKIGKLFRSKCESDALAIMKRGKQKDPKWTEYERKMGEYKQKKEEIERENKELEQALNRQKDYDQIVEDELWILRSYIRCCPVVRVRTSKRSDDESYVGHELQNLSAPAPMDGAVEEYKEDALADTMMEYKPVDSYDPSKGKPPREGRMITHEDIAKGGDDAFILIPADATCEDQTTWFQRWQKHYLYAAQQEGEWSKHVEGSSGNATSPPPAIPDLPRRKALTVAMPNKISVEEWNRVGYAWERVARGLTRCCKPGPGPMPTGTNRFPSVPRSDPWP